MNKLKETVLLNECANKLCRRCVDGQCRSCSYRDRCIKCDIDEESDTYGTCVNKCGEN